jgi:poly-gamma-glutamate capsule biosynthesis protein CapA/YwtB (metallophosphatase superfamily)
MRDHPYPARVRLPRLGLLVVLLVALGGCDTALLSSASSGTASPAGSVASATAPPPASEPPAAPSASAGGTSAGVSGSTTEPAATDSPPAAPLPSRMSLAVVTGFTNYKANGLTTKQLVAELKAGDVLVPCGTEEGIAEALGTNRSGWAKCVQVGSIAGRLGSASTDFGLIPVGFVSPRVKVVPLDGADLFGMGPARNKEYPLTLSTPTNWKAEWVAYDKRDVRVLLFTGVNCADRGVSRQTIVLGKGWDWMLEAGTAQYTGRHWDGRFGWWVVDAKRTGNAGAVAKLIKDADVAVSDFECPISKNWRHHDNGTVFTIDPRVAALMDRAGFDLATIGTDHMTNAGLSGVGDTVDAFKEAGIKTIGGGRTPAEASKPAVITVRGMRFGFVAWNGAPGSAVATSSSAGVQPLNSATIKSAISAAQKVSDVVIAMPQWSTVEYTTGFTSAMAKWREEMFAAGADHIIGADTHWAGAISLTPGGAYGNRLAVASQGNFWFGQDWSRQTQEGFMTQLTFVGKRLAAVRLIPTVVLDNAQPNLTNPATDGQFVLNQVFGASILKAR